MKEGISIKGTKDLLVKNIKKNVFYIRIVSSSLYPIEEFYISSVYSPESCIIIWYLVSALHLWLSGLRLCLWVQSISHTQTIILIICDYHSSNAR